MEVVVTNYITHTVNQRNKGMPELPKNMSRNKSIQETRKCLHGNIAYQTWL